MNFTTNIPAPWRVLLLLLVLVLSVLFTGCEEEEDELSGPFGPGVGGLSVPQGTIQNIILQTSGGTTYGSFEYDGGASGYWADTGAAVDPVLFIYINRLGADNIGLSLTQISGRPDTPCRFVAAIKARDEGYTILGAGDRTNDQGLEFHQVNLAKSGENLNLYCTTIQNNLGVMITGIAASSAILRYEQVHFILNSVSP